MLPTLSSAAVTGGMDARPPMGYERGMAVTRLLARPLLASFFVINGVHSLRHAREIAPQAAPVTDALAPLAQRAAPNASVPTDPVTWVRVNGAVQVVAGAALATGKMPRIAAAVLAASLVPSTAARYRFWEAADSHERAEQQNHFLKNAALVGGLVIAAGDTEGQPGIAWRARHAAKDARREAHHLAASAKREAKLVKAELT
jgi:uncharacterized membrane protein YphA (DoxX/SURF4 family)